MIEQPEPEETEMEELEEPEKELLNSTEEEFILNLLKMDKIMPGIYEGFTSFRDLPVFIVTGENEGIFLNPLPEYLDTSTPIEHKFPGFEPLEMFRNEEMLSYVIDNMGYFYGFEEFPSGFIYYYNIWVDFPRTFYHDSKDVNGYFYEAVFFHELFHLYSNTVIDFIGDENIQNFGGYPLTEDTMPLLILLFKVMKDAYFVDNQSDFERYLSYYISIQNKLLEVDPTPDNLIRTHGLYQEKIEGSARYVEVFASLDALDNTFKDPTHGYADYADSITQNYEVTSVYSQRIFYHTGAAVLFLLKQLDHTTLEEDMALQTNTPYDIAEDFLQLNDTEKEQILEEVKNNYQWESILKRADYLLNL